MHHSTRRFQDSKFESLPPLPPAGVHESTKGRDQEEEISTPFCHPLPPLCKAFAHFDRFGLLDGLEELKIPGAISLHWDQAEYSKQSETPGSSIHHIVNE